MHYSFWALLLLLLLLSSAVEGQKHLTIAESFVGVSETTGKNDGPEVEMFLKSVGRRKGDSWCSAFVSYCLTIADVKEPKVRSGLARDFKRSKYVIPASEVLRGVKTIPPGSIVGWEKGNTIFGHIGFVLTDWKKQYGTTIEGNTSSGVKGSQSDGDGVYIRSRSIQPANYFRIMWFILVK
ncbi:MAG: hypothetical protein RDU14_17525 [Melioribacteraceae bacterium]|nr:hypothetical protein [Melioribacteraceae bacterium]